MIGTERSREAGRVRIAAVVADLFRKKGDLQMKPALSMWSSYYVDLSPEEAISELARHGVRHCELSDEHAKTLLGRGAPREVGQAFGAHAAAEGVSVLQGHLWLACKICTDPDAVSVLTDWMTLFSAIGIRSAVLHCDRLADEKGITDQERLDRNVAVLRQLAPIARERGIVICLENLTWLYRPEDFRYLLDAVDSPALGICLDTGHLNLVGGDQAAFIRAAGDRLRALHVADNEGKHDQHLMPYGRGTVDIAAVTAALSEIGYSGLFNYEIPGERSCPLPIRAHKLTYIRACYDYLMQTCWQE